MTNYTKLEVRVLGDPADVIRGMKGPGHDNGDPELPFGIFDPFGDPEE